MPSSSPFSRRSLLQGAAALIATPAVASVGAPAPASPLAAGGAVHRTLLSAPQLVLALSGKGVLTQGFAGTRVIRVSPSGEAMEYEVLEFSLVADTERFGRVRLFQAENERGRGAISVAASGALAEKWVQPVKISVERMGNAVGPFVLETVAPAVWVSTGAAQFPLSAVQLGPALIQSRV